jgi:dicarboxylate/amino acid:cation (Na+ or H+) symporter, DAACS family
VRRLNPAASILIGLLAGVVLGAWVAPLAPWVADVAGRLAGQIFLRLLLVVVMPLAAAALVLGVAEVKPGALVGVAGRALGLTLGLTSVAVAIGLTLVSVVRPGDGVDRASLPAADSVVPIDTSPVDALVGIIPNNVVTAAASGDLLGVLVVALLLGLALRTAKGPAVETFHAAVQGFFDVCSRAVRMVMRLAPIGVAGLACTLVARAGLPALLSLGRLVVVAAGAMLIQAVVVYPLCLRFLGRRSPLAFYKATEPALVMAFSTASSAATLPTTLRVAEENLRLRPELARFILTVGASANQNGSALWEGVAVLFLAQLYGVALSLGQQAVVVGISILAGVGTAGVPGASLPVIAAVAGSLGIPAESVGVLIGVDRFLDMCRTTLNVAGDLVIAAVVERGAVRLDAGITANEAAAGKG